MTTPKPGPALVEKLNTPYAQKMLPHILSPIEMALVNHQCQPFMYSGTSTPVYISEAFSKQLLSIMLFKFDLLTAQAEKDKLSKHIPLHQRELFDDPRQVLSLYPNLRNRLCALECYSLYTIMRKGRAYFAHEQKFSVYAMQTLDSVFEKHGCELWFK